MNQLDYIVFDFETTGFSPTEDEAIQVAAVAYNARTLEPYPAEQGGEFCSMMRPLRPERLTLASVGKALAVNKKTPAEILAAPDQGTVWNEFIRWVGRYNKKGGPFGAPIACGKNIRAFDLKFVEQLNLLHAPNKGKQTLFSTRRQLDLEDLLGIWFENDPELDNHSMDNVRKYFGMDGEGAHDALVDARQTGELIFRFLKVHRKLRQPRPGGRAPIVTFRAVPAAA